MPFQLRCRLLGAAGFAAFMAALPSSHAQGGAAANLGHRAQPNPDRRLTGNNCDEAGDCVTPGAERNEAIYSQADATFRGGKFQSQWDFAPLGSGLFGIENQFDVVRATFADGSNVPRIPPVRLGGGVY